MCIRLTFILVGLACFFGNIASVSAADRLEQWISQARQGNEAERLEALQALGESGSMRAIPVLVEALNDSKSTIRERAFAALQTLAQALQHAYHAVAQWIEQLLASVQAVINPPPQPEIEWTGQRYSI